MLRTELESPAGRLLHIPALTYCHITWINYIFFVPKCWKNDTFLAYLKLKMSFLIIYYLKNYLYSFYCRIIFDSYIEIARIVIVSEASEFQ